jgi:nitrate/TMAO reductase-like tetraheme cytochrome c subunit
LDDYGGKDKEEWWIMVRLTLSQKAWLIGIGMVGIFLAVNLIFVLIGYSTNSPSECKTCHSGSYKLWKENKAHRESITCTFCHSNHSSSQFAYAASRFSNMPKALDQDCIKCHKNYMEEKKKKILVFAEQLDEEGGKVVKVFGPWNLKDITCRSKFSCIVCHKNIAHDRGLSPSNLPRVDYCADCHYHRAKDPFSQVSPRPRLVFVENGKKMISPAIR